VPHLPARSRRTSRILGCALAAASVCLGAPGVALADATTLTTDAGTSALVTAGQLSPGHVVERCVVVTTPTEYTSADLGMFVTTAGTLADHLNVTVESGAGGSFADCTGFSGRLVFVGTLAALAAGFDTTRPERVGHYSTGRSSVSLRLRFSVQDDNSAQGLTTAASFWWLALAPDQVTPPTTDDPVPSSTPTSAPTSSLTSAPPRTTVPPAPATPPTTAGTVPGITRPPSPGPSTPATPSSAPATTPAPVATTLAPPVGVPLTGQGGPPPGGTPSGSDEPGLVTQLANGLATGVAKAAQTLSTAAAPALKGAAVTSLMILPLVLLFVLVNRWFDRRDPKLALAPSYGDPFLGFVDRSRLHPQGEPS
jgi:hypothetical protein